VTGVLTLPQVGEELDRLGGNVVGDIDRRAGVVVQVVPLREGVHLGGIPGNSNAAS
jgi:hypothetical protein